MQWFRLLVFGFIPAALTGACGPVPNLRDFLEADLRPPQLQNFTVPDARSLRIAFDEPVQLVPDSVRTSHELPIQAAGTEGNDVLIVMSREMTAGLEYRCEVAVRDENGNSMTVMVPFFGYNGELPKIRINEFITRGSGNHPDLVEIVALTGGNMGGVCLYEGTPGDWEHRFVFPAMSVEAGDHLLVHFKPEGTPEEVDEIHRPADSGGLDAHPDAFDFWIPGGSGISGNNGVLSLYASPAGDLIDGVLYSNRTSESDDRYRGFGSAKVLRRAEELVAHGGWTCAQELVRPEDGVNPEGSTATRSLCRSADSGDSDAARDWHIVPTRGATFGETNTEERYVP